MKSLCDSGWGELAMYTPCIDESQIARSNMQFIINRVHRLAKHTRSFHARSQNLIPMIWRLDAIDSASHQVDDRIGAIQHRRPIVHSASVPRDKGSRSGRLWRISRQDSDIGAMFRKMCGKRYA